MAVANGLQLRINDIETAEDIFRQINDNFNKGEDRKGLGLGLLARKSK